LVKFVRGKVLSAGLTVGVILVAIFLARKFNLGEQIVGGFGGIGETIGSSFAAIPRGIIAGGGAGFGGLGEEFIKQSEDFQRFVNGGRLFSEQAPKTDVQGDFVGGKSLKELLTIIERNPIQLLEGIKQEQVTQGLVFTNLKELFAQSGVGPANTKTVANPFDLSKFIQNASTRITASRARAASGSGSTTFGGFSSAVQQEAGLQATLARNQALFPGFFK